MIGEVRRTNITMDTSELFHKTPADLEEIYLAVRRIDLATMKIPSREMGFVSLASSRMARSVKELGHDGTPLHDAITDYLIDLTAHWDVRVALTGTYALAEHGIPPRRVLEHLKSLVITDRRSDDHSDVSLRAIALRMLRRLDDEIAAEFRDFAAFAEYRHAISHWLTTDAAKNPETARELHAEREWLLSEKHRRTPE